MTDKKDKRIVLPYGKFEDHTDYLRANFEEVKKHGIKNGLSSYYSWAKTHKLLPEVNEVLKNLGYRARRVRIPGRRRNTKTSLSIDDFTEEEEQLGADFTLDEKTGQKKYISKHIEKYNKIVELLIERAKKEGKSESELKQLIDKLSRRDDETDED